MYIEMAAVVVAQVPTLQADYRTEVTMELLLTLQSHSSFTIDCTVQMKGEHLIMPSSPQTSQQRVRGSKHGKAASIPASRSLSISQEEEEEEEEEGGGDLARGLPESIGRMMRTEAAGVRSQPNHQWRVRGLARVTPGATPGGPHQA